MCFSTFFDLVHGQQCRSPHDDFNQMHLESSVLPPAPPSLYHCKGSFSGLVPWAFWSRVCLFILGCAEFLKKHFFSFLRRLCLETMIAESDGEPAIRELAEELSKLRQKQTRTRTALTHSSQSNGADKVATAVSTQGPVAERFDS